MDLIKDIREHRKTMGYSNDPSVLKKKFGEEFYEYSEEVLKIDVTKERIEELFDVMVVEFARAELKGLNVEQIMYDKMKTKEDNK